MKRYIVQLDNDKYGWTFLWGFTIREIKKHCTRLEILSTIMPLLMIETNESSFVVKNIEGVKHIEEECKGYASLGEEDINQESTQLPK